MIYTAPLILSDAVFIIGLIDRTGAMVLQYAYDTWGKQLSVTGTLASTVGTINPFRYRGYVYDDESGLYYLQSRYYNPEWCRFINADDTDILTASSNIPNWDKNLFAYCDNDPVNRIDDGGQFWNFIAGAVIGAASVYVGDILENVMSGKSGWDIFKPTSSVGTYLGAAASGLIPGGGLASIIARPIISTGVKYGVDIGILKNPINAKSIAADLTVNGVGEILSLGLNKVLGKARPQNYSSFRNQLTRRLPHITQQQTKQIMYSINTVINAAIQALEIAIEAVTNR